VPISDPRWGANTHLLPSAVAAITYREFGEGEVDGEKEEPIEYTEQFKDMYIEVEKQVWSDVNIPIRMKNSQISVGIMSKVYEKIVIAFTPVIARLTMEFLFKWVRPYRVLNHVLHSLNFTSTVRFRVLEAPKGRAKDRFRNRQQGSLKMRKHYTDQLWESVKHELEEEIYAKIVHAHDEVISSVREVWGVSSISTVKEITDTFIADKLSKLFPLEFKVISQLSLSYFVREIEQRLIEEVNQEQYGLSAERYGPNSGESSFVRVSLSPSISTNHPL